MSVHIQSMVWFREFNTPAQKLVALCLADFCDDDGKCWPSNALVARKCGLSDVTVENAISVFLACGLITREARARDDGTRTSSLTRFNVAVLDAQSRAGRKLAIADAARDKKNAQEGEKEPRVLPQKEHQKPGGKKQGGIGEIHDPVLAKSTGGHEPSVNHQPLRIHPLNPLTRKSSHRKSIENTLSEYPKSLSELCVACGLDKDHLNKTQRTQCSKCISEVVDLITSYDDHIFGISDDDLSEQIKERSKFWQESKKWTLTSFTFKMHWNTPLK